MQNPGNFKNILCVRADNMGDVIMSYPAIRALKETFDCKITLLTSKSGNIIGDHLPAIDEVLTFDLPWVKSTSKNSGKDLSDLAEKLKTYHFDAAIIFTVYSQSALPAAMLMMMADIPERLAYSRENPYGLLTDWIPDLEPYDYILHQVERDLNLVKSLGASLSEDSLSLKLNDNIIPELRVKLSSLGIDPQKPFLILHPGVSEEKRKYPTHLWIETGKLLREKYPFNLLITGSESEAALAESIQNEIGLKAFSLAGKLTIGEFIGLISISKAVISVNTSTIHIAAAMKKPQVVLYACTNPQHTPWKSPHKVLPFSVDKNLKSSNTIIKFVSEKLYNDFIPYPAPLEITSSLKELLDHV
ncbi:glycosyltransferase family 9 protein [Dyadobacter subterraneus]|uniref:Glycosyltransferase family 9 protein n=1 Tax=Dyadobacter subterraneus TaxID=2773304 RepID=A0ABR9WFG2_9BACT|nr:glycosyltransferase family 9 protein [Dyadobacter subterraneus]MBE9464246.1 glycosyltransferase family 9 protein [Dyadobacter subterraneus]